jgi:hypothetical protein
MCTYLLQVLMRFITIIDYTMPRVCYCIVSYRNLITIPYGTVPYMYYGLIVILFIYA